MSGATSPRAEDARPALGDRSDRDRDEVELKLTVHDPGAIRELVLDPAPRLPGVAPIGPARRIEVADRYLDTAGGALRRAGLVARVRSGAEPPRLTLKSLARRGHGAVHRRLELEGAADHGDDPRGWPPSEARDLLIGAIGATPIAIIAVLRQARLQRDIAIGDSIVELSLDEVEAARPGGEPDRWVELEAELRSGGEADLAILGTMLLNRPDLAPATTSKLHRALAAARGR